MIGQYVTYKGLTHIVVDESKDMCKLLNPIEGNKKLHINKRNAALTNYRPAVVVEHKENDYIVTRLGNIISYATGRVMRWNDDHGMRQSILAKADKQLTV